MAQDADQPRTEAAGISFMITKAKKEQLRERGFSSDAIASLTAARAHEILAVEPEILWS